MKIYEIDLSQEGLTSLDNIIDNIANLFYNEDFKEFLVQKCQSELEDICTQSLNSNLENFGEEATYMNGMFVEITQDYIMLGNNSVIDVTNKIKSDEKRARYIGGVISLAKIVEYGVGYVGKDTLDVGQEENGWYYDMNNYGDKSWAYYDDNGNLHWTKGYVGKLIFYQLKERIVDNIGKWVNEYLNYKL